MSFTYKDVNKKGKDKFTSQVYQRIGKKIEELAPQKTLSSIQLSQTQFKYQTLKKGVTQPIKEELIYEDSHLSQVEKQRPKMQMS